MIHLTVLFCGYFSLNSSKLLDNAMWHNTVVNMKFGMHSSFERVVGHCTCPNQSSTCPKKNVQIIVYNSPARPKAILRKDDSLMLATIHEQCLPFYIINEVGHLTTFVDHLAEFCQNYHLAAICTQLMVKFFLQLRFIRYFDCKCMKIPDFSRIDSHFVA